MTLPAFQAQNPAISKYPLGWASCTAFSAAMCASFDRQVPQLCTGGQVRQRTGDTEGGLSLAQVDLALNSGWQIDLDTRYRLPWADFAKAIDGGRGAILQGWYAPIADSRFDAGAGFRGNHAIAVFPGWVVMDPLADGRRPGIYKYHGEAYPQQLLRSFAGLLNLGSSKLGDGFVYASLTRPIVEQQWRAVVKPAVGWKGFPDYRYFAVWTVNGTAITGKTGARTGGFSATCTAPRLYSWKGHPSQRLVRLTSGSRAGTYLSAIYATEV